MNEQYLPQTESTYKALQAFESVDEMNGAIKAHKQAHDLTQTERDILDAISRYACKYPGVSYISKQRLAEDAGYKSRRTAIRSCNRLEALGIIVQHETRRVTGDKRQSSNIIVIQAIKAKRADEVTPKSHAKETSAKANLNNTYLDTEIDEKPSTDAVIKRGLKQALPAPIYKALAPFLNGQALYDTYGILLRAKAKIDRSITLETYADRYIDAFYNVVRLYKAGNVRSFKGLLYVAWERLTAEISRQRAANNSRMAIAFKDALGIDA